METRFIVETSKSQVPRRPKLARDGSMQVYVSRRHYAVFMYIASKVLGKPSYTPSYQEIAEVCGYRNRDGAYRAVLALGELGLLTTDVRRARSVQLTEQGEQVYGQWKDKRKAR
jgi:hypothetical protein